MINPSDKTEVLAFIIKMVEAHDIIEQSRLIVSISSEYPTIEPNDVLENLSTAAQDGLVKRFEYKLLGRWTYKYFYMPAGTQLS